MKKIFAFILLINLISSCTFDFLTAPEDEGSGGGDSIPVVITYSEDGLRRDAYQGDEHLWYEILEKDVDGNETFFQHFEPNGTLIYSMAYVFENGLLVLEARFNHLDELQWFRTFTYDGEQRILSASYGENFDLQEFESWMYDSEGNELQYARFNHVQDPEPEVKSARWRVVDVDLFANVVAIASYTGPGALEDETRVDPTPGTAQYDENQNSLGIPVPLAPIAPTVPNIDFFTFDEGTLDLIRLEVTETDELGSSRAVFENLENLSANIGEDFPWESLLPTSVSRSFSDENIRDIRVDLAYNNNNQLVGKSTYYGNTLALDLDFTFNQSGLVEQLATTGESLIVPLTYNITYYPESNVPKELQIETTGVALQYLVFEYEDTNQDGTIDLPIEESLPELEGLIDPIVFSQGLFKIHQFDWDNNYLGTYTFDYDYNQTGNIRIEYGEYGDDLNADSINSPSDLNSPTTIDYDRTNYTPGGYFLATLNLEGFVASFGSYNAADELQWEYTYDFSILGEALTEVRRNAEGIVEEVTSINTSDPGQVFEQILRMFF